MTALLQLHHVTVGFTARGHSKNLLRGVSLQLLPGQILGVVGESGAGKSMLARAVLGTLPRDASITNGQIHLAGQDITYLKQRQRRALYRDKIALIPQDPMTALNPSRRIGAQLDDVIRRRHRGTRRRKQALALLDDVQIGDPERVVRQYPHELSGGMRQRILIAMAFAAAPPLIIADEPTTALDVTVQKQILRVIRLLQREHGTALLFITHDLGVIAKMADAVAVLFGGMVVEQAPTAALFSAPSETYTAALLATTPRYDRPAESLVAMPDHIRTSLNARLAAFDQTPTPDHLDWPDAPGA